MTAVGLRRDALYAVAKTGAMPCPKWGSDWTAVMPCGWWQIEADCERGDVADDDECDVDSSAEQRREPATEERVQGEEPPTVRGHGVVAVTADRDVEERVP